MNIAKFFFNSRGLSNLYSRTLSLFTRFGCSPKRMERYLNRITEMCRQHGFSPTFPATAVVVKRYPETFRRLREKGMEFAIHGLVHTDYSQLSYDRQREHMEKAKQIFEEVGIDYNGYRSPYLKDNEYTCPAIGACSFKWASCIVVDWPVVLQNEFLPSQWNEYQKVLNLYNSVSATNRRVIPCIHNGHVEIPVSIPDDEACVDRLSLKRNTKKIESIWRKVLTLTHERGEVFTIQFHHERFPYCEMPLKQVLDLADTLAPAVFKGTLSQLTSWWNSRNSSEITLEVDESNYILRIKAPSEATILCKGFVKNPSLPFFSDYTVADKREFHGEGVVPGVALSEGAHPSWEKQLREEGFAIVPGKHRERASFIVEETEPVTEVNTMQVLKRIDTSPQPLVRLWRWPNNCRSALCVTGDIDSMTLQDFLFRIWEV